MTTRFKANLIGFVLIAACAATAGLVTVLAKDSFNWKVTKTFTLNSLLEPISIGRNGSGLLYTPGDRELYCVAAITPGLAAFGPPPFNRTSTGRLDAQKKYKVSVTSTVRGVTCLVNGTQTFVAYIVN